MSYRQKFEWGLVARSVSNELKTALLEWKLFGHRSVGGNPMEKCICSHDIKEIFYLCNKVNGESIKVGNCCVAVWEDDKFNITSGFSKRMKAMQRNKTEKGKLPNNAWLNWNQLSNVISEKNADFVRLRLSANWIQTDFNEARFQRIMEQAESTQTFDCASCEQSFRSIVKGKKKQVYCNQCVDKMIAESGI
jgi:hypothetical protein